MSYTGHTLKPVYNEKGELIDPEDILIDRVSKMFGNIAKSNCFKCKHLAEDEVSCKAFPNVIPNNIITGQRTHDKPIKGDNGIQFEIKGRIPLK